MYTIKHVDDSAHKHGGSINIRVNVRDCNFRVLLIILGVFLWFDFVINVFGNGVSLSGGFIVELGGFCDGEKIWVFEN